ncbi:MAG: ATP-binding protein [Clostridiales bacterium]|nr:MAG: ATP-binding protein [Clostridiales bacterium]
MMQELSLNILDIAQNSVRAEASLVEITVARNTADKRLRITIRDDGCGMTEEQVKQVTDPFFTTRTTRSIGLGIPFFKMTAEMTGGSFAIHSTLGKGTETMAEYCYDHIDMLPLGDIPSTITTLISGSPQIAFVYRYEADGRTFTLDTREVKEMLGDVDICSNEILTFLRDMIAENTREIDGEHNSIT